MINDLISRHVPKVPIINLMAVMENHQITSLTKDAGSVLHFTAFRRSTQIGLLYAVSLFYSALSWVDRPASLGRNSKRRNASFKRRSVPRRRRWGSRLFTVPTTGRRSVVGKAGPIRKRSLTKAPTRRWHSTTAIKFEIGTIRLFSLLEKWIIRI